jgi:hypothetical protein
MNIFTEIERLINEHGSTAILNEIILLLKTQHDIFTNEITAHRKKIAGLDAEILALKKEISVLKKINKKLELDNNEFKYESDISHIPHPDLHACECCGSIQLKRIGSRPNPTFGELGVKDAILQCENCGETTVIISP